MANNKLSIGIILVIDDGSIHITNGERKNSLIITMKNVDNEKSSICITKKQLNDITNLVNEKL